METWREIPGWEGRYLVSDQGAVRSLVMGRLLRQALDEDGYLLVSLTRGDGLFRTAKVHQLVLEAFVGPKPLGAVTRHLDGVRTNNVLPNLRWGTHSENMADRAAHGVSYKGENNNNAKLTPEDVVFIRAYPRHWGAQRELAKKFGVRVVAINRIINGVTWSHLN